MKRLILIVVGGVLIVAGGVWLLQGVGVLPGSVMTGDSTWVVIGSITAAVGVVIVIVGILVGRRR